MKWNDLRRSQNIEDQRQNAAPRSAAMGGASLMRFIPMLLGTRKGRMILLIGVVVFFGAKMLGIDLQHLLTGSTSMPRAASEAPKALSEKIGSWVNLSPPS